MEMLPLIPIVILSVIEGMDPRRGLLFSFFFTSFGRKELGLILPLLITLLYYIVGVVPIVLVPLDTNVIRYVIIYLLILHSIVKVIMGRVLHYSGGFRPSLLEVCKWVIINSVTQMSFILPMGIYAVNVIGIIVFLAISVTIKELMAILCRKSSKLLLTVTSYNFDYLYIAGIAGLIIGIVLSMS
ncbi:hypothetical protein [Metallosphaera javensis (ex Sakai et al. 2022)]|uniref:hypothetical protein n=1 Tax=Metallosphaera javensis (ex Sakai et al. 2022) TaxID=2775498 RepID=UPI0025882AA2